jgi:hypothetical protein
MDQRSLGEGLEREEKGSKGSKAWIGRPWGTCSKMLTPRGRSGCELSMQREQQSPARTVWSAASPRQASHSASTTPTATLAGPPPSAQPSSTSSSGSSSLVPYRPTRPLSSLRRAAGSHVRTDRKKSLEGEGLPDQRDRRYGCLLSEEGERGSEKVQEG